MKIGDLYFEVTADTSSARASVSAIGDAARESGRLIAGALTTAFTVAAAAATAAVGAIITQTIRMGVAFNEASQLAFGLFAALTGSLESATSLMREFTQLSLDIPLFDPAQLQRTTSLLLTFNVAAEDAFDLAQNINLAAIALDRGSTGAIALARAIGQIQGRGWLEGDEARQLSEVGVNAYKAIADATGLTTGEVMKLGKEQRLLAEDVIPILSDALDETFGPVAQNLLNTYAAQARGVRNALTGIGSAIAEPFIGRAGGGVVVDFLSDVRTELNKVIEVADDGTFKLVGSLESINDLTAAVADGFTEIGDAFVSGLGSALDSRGFENAISGLTEAVPDVVDTLLELASGTGDFFADLISAIGPILPSVEQLVGILYDFGREALPLVAEGFTELVRGAAPIVKELADIGIGLLEIASPALIQILQTLVDVISDLADIIEALAPLIDDAILAFISFKAAVIIAEVATASFTVVTLSALATSLIRVTALAGAALIALGAVNSLRAAASGEEGFRGWLNEDVPFYERPFQLAGQFGMSLRANEWGAWRDETTMAFNDATAAAAQFDTRLLASVETFDEARSLAVDYGQAIGLVGNGLSHFANLVALAWDEMQRGDTVTGEVLNNMLKVASVVDEVLGTNFVDTVQAEHGARNLADAYRDQADAYLRFLEGRELRGRLLRDEREEIDLMKDLKAATDQAWESVDRLMKVDSGSTLDDFLRSLPGLAEDLTDALSQDGGILRDLSVSGALGDVTNEAIDIVRTLAEEYGMSMDEIRALFDERGLSAVIEALGTITRQTTETIDPLILKYGQLDATVGQLQDAIARLEDQRTSRLRNQIDQVRAAMDDARLAADAAREAFDNFFTGQAGGLQGAIDELVLAVPRVGDQVEKGLLTGGVQGEALVRQALAGLGQNLSSAFQIGLEQGLSPEDIISQLAPVYASIQQELTSGRGRIQTLNWTDGFTPQAAAEIQNWMASVLDPGQIGTLFSNILGADSAVSGLQSQLKRLTAELNAEVEFSPEQVQAAMDEIRVTTVTEPVVTEEAAQAVWEAIQDVLDDEDLEASIDRAVLIQDILDAAREAERSITLDFGAGITFDQQRLRQGAANLGVDFATAFNEGLIAVAQEQWLQQGGGPTTADALERTMQSLMQAILTGQPPQITIDAPITVEGSPSPYQTAAETVKALGAAAGSGGQLTTPTYIVPPNLRTGGGGGSLRQ